MAERIVVIVVKETRKPRNGDKYMYDNGAIYTATCDFAEKAYPIVDVYETEIPEWARAYAPYFVDEIGHSSLAFGKRIPLDSPPKRRYKWRLNGIDLYTNPITEKELRQLPDWPAFSPVMESEEG